MIPTIIISIILIIVIGFAIRYVKKKELATVDVVHVQQQATVFQIK